MVICFVFSPLRGLWRGLWGYRKGATAILLGLAAILAAVAIWYYVDAVMPEPGAEVEPNAAAEHGAHADGGHGGGFIGDIGRGLQGAVDHTGQALQTVGQAVNPMNWLFGPMYKAILYTTSIATSAVAGLAGIGVFFMAEGSYAPSWKNKNKYLGLLSCILMVAAMACAHYTGNTPTAMMGWLTKGFVIAGVISALLTAVLFWREPKLSETGRSGPSLDVEHECDDSDNIDAGIVPSSPSPPTALTVPPSDIRRRLIEQKFRFSDHSLLLAAFIVLVSAAVYGFIQETKYSEIATPKLRSKRRFRTGIP